MVLYCICSLSNIHVSESLGAAALIWLSPNGEVAATTLGQYLIKRSAVRVRETSPQNTIMMMPVVF